MATDSGYQHHHHNHYNLHPRMMAPTNTHQPNEKEQEPFYDEPIQQVNPFYPAMDFTIPNFPPTHSSFQPANWQCEPNDMMWMEVLQPWPMNSGMNALAPVFSDWQTNAMPAWEFQGHNNMINPPVAHGLPAQTPSPVRTDSTYQQSPVRFEETYGGNNTWNGGWVEEIPHTVDEVVSSVEVGQEAMTIDLAIPIQAPVPVDAPTPRRRRALTPTMNSQEYVTSVTEHPAQPLPVRAEKRRRAPTPTVDFDDYFTPVAEPTPIPQATITQPTPQPSSLARPATARREAVAKVRRGSSTVFKTQSANSKRGHYASDVWEAHKATIRKLYIDDGKPLRELIRIMEKEHDFPAT